MKNQIKILIADDHPLFRKGLKDLLEETGREFSIDEAGNGELAVDLIKQNNYDIAMLDIDMPGLNGLEVAEECKRNKIDVKIIILTMYKDEHLFNKSVDVGVMGYLLKENAVVEIYNAISSVLEGHYYICPAISEFVLNRKNKLDNAEKEKQSASALTDTERTILKLIAESKTSKEIAEELFVSVKTIEKHRFNICNKLNIHGTHALIKYAFDNRDMFLS